MAAAPLILNGLIGRARTDCQRLVNRLLAIIPDKKLAMGLVENADVHGIDTTLAHMRANPQSLGLSRQSPLLSLQTQSTPAYILDSVLASQMRLLQAVRHREELLKKDDPTRVPVYIIDGREMTINYENGRLIPTEPPTTGQSMNQINNSLVTSTLSTKLGEARSARNEESWQRIVDPREILEPSVSLTSW